MIKQSFFLVALFKISFAFSQTLTVEKIMADPKWIGSQPAGIFWSYNSRQVHFQWNPEKAISDSAYSYSINTALPVKTTYQNARFAAAINAGRYNRQRTKIVFAYEGDIYLLDVLTGNPVRITHTSAYESNPVFSNDEKWIVYESSGNLFAWTIDLGSIRQLTDFRKEQPLAAKPDAQADFLKQQQLRTSSVIAEKKSKADTRAAYLQAVKNTDTIPVINTGGRMVKQLAISPSGRFITYNLFTTATLAVSTHVPSYVTLNGYTTDIPSREKVGASQGSSVFYVFDRERDTSIAVSMDALPGIYDMPVYVNEYPKKLNDTTKHKRQVFVDAISWNNSGTAAVLDIRSADFKDRWLMLLDAPTGSIQLLNRQHDDAWIAGPGIGWYGGGLLEWLSDTVFFFQSEADGFSHLYTCDILTKKIKQVTKGAFEVQQVTISNNKKYFYIITNEAHPGLQHFYRINTDGSNKVQLTSLHGCHEVTLSPDEKYIAYRYSYQNKPWELYVQENAAGKKPVQVTTAAASAEWSAYAWRDTKIFSFANRTGQQVYARLYEPPASKKNNAAVIFVHGAGYLQNIKYGWSYYFREYMFNNLLADKGYTVLDIDYSASAGYGRNWRTAIYRHMGGKDLDDEVDAARYLVKELGIDSNRIGMYGGSYGGFMTLMALFTQPQLFKAGAALRPVTDWAHYNDGYTGAILNRPADDSIAYNRSSPINFADGLKGHLLICHGMVDVNVHYQDAVRLAQRLIELGKNNWELAAYPVEDHGFTEPSSWADEYKRILKLFDEQLLK
jgi:dipeptidyl aminopeptidase/acylaminoacyl peptidase